MQESYSGWLCTARLAGLCLPEEQRRAGRSAAAPGPGEGWPWPEESSTEGGWPGRRGRRHELQKSGRAANEKKAAGRQGKGGAAGWADEDVVECRGCLYWRTLDYILGVKACWYPLMENRLRPCRPADCYRRPGTPYRPCNAQGRPPDEEPGAAEDGQGKGMLT